MSGRNSTPHPCEQHSRAARSPGVRPCRSMAPQFERAVATLEPRLRLLKLYVNTARDTIDRAFLAFASTVVLASVLLIVVLCPAASANNTRHRPNP